MKNEIAERVIAWVLPEEGQQAIEVGEARARELGRLEWRGKGYIDSRTGDLRRLSGWWNK